MRVCFAFWQNPAGYSGGRYHAWLLALSLAQAGHDVTVWTNRRPAFADDFGTALETVKVRLDPSFSTPPARADFLVICPHQGADKHFHYIWLLAADAARMPVILVSFETPNWLAAEGMPTRGWLNWRPWLACGAVASRILSITATGDRYAQAWYGGAAERFAPCLPPCNEVALAPTDGPRDIDLLVFARAGARDYHKGGHLLPQLVGGLPGGTRAMVFGDAARIDPRVREATAAAARTANVTLAFSGLVNDAEKLRLFARTRVVASLSLFEGFGYTPVEARVSGARVVAFALAVFQELHATAAEVRLVPMGDLPAFIAAVRSSLTAEFAGRDAAVRQAREDYSWRRAARQFEAAMLTVTKPEPRPLWARMQWQTWRLALAIEAALRRQARVWHSRSTRTKPTTPSRPHPEAVSEERPKI